MVKNEIDAYIEKNDLMNDSQHGFRRGRLTQTNLIEFMNTTMKWFDEGKCFDVIFLDFFKAFDVVCHKRLMVKLEAVGIKGKSSSGSWIGSLTEGKEWWLTANTRIGWKY